MAQCVDTVWSRITDFFADNAKTYRATAIPFFEIAMTSERSDRLKQEIRPTCLMLMARGTLLTCFDRVDE